jgi:sarcosine oxidase
MDEGYGLWHELQNQVDHRFVHEPGLLYFGSFESDNLRQVIKGLQQLSVPHELLDPEQAKRVFPALRLRQGEIGILTPEAGWVNAQLAVRSILELSVAAGAKIVSSCRIFDDWLPEQFDRYVLCPGAWITDFAPVPVRVTLQTFGYVAPDNSGPMEGPVWIDDCEHFFYGFPSEPDSQSFKIGVHRAGAAADPSQSSREPNPDEARAIRNEAAERFGVDEASYEFHGCLYTNTADEDFLFGRHGETGFFCSACSGHGFKFGPWMGSKLADFIEGKDAPEDHPRFCWPKPKLEA